MPERILRPFVSADGRRLNLAAYGFLFALCLAFFVPGIASLPPIDRDEPWFAQATKQMIETHNYVDIRYQEAERYKKPIGIYWLQAASVRLLNPDHLNEIWAYRIPSLLGATIAVLLTAALGALLFTARVGLLAGIMMAGCLVLNAEAHLAKTDAVLLAAIMVAQYALALAYKEKIRSWKSPFAFWSAVGIGFLIKGPMILLVLASTLLWLWRKNKNLGWFAALKPRWGIPYALMLILPWFIAITLASHGAFLAQSAGKDMLAKLWQGQDRGTVLPPGLYLLAFPVTFFPFSLFALLALPDAWAARRDQAVAFCLGWIIPTWLIFELSLTKLPHYVMPTYPAIAMLTAKFVCDGFAMLDQKKRRWLVAAILSLWLVIGTALVMGTIFVPYIVDQKWNLYAVAAGAALIITEAVGIALLFLRANISALLVVAYGALIFLGVTMGNTFPNIEHLWLSRDIVRMAEQVKPCARLKIASAPYDEPSLVFLGGTGTKLYLDGAHASAEMQKNPCTVAVVEDNRLGAFLNGPQDTGNRSHPVATLRSYSIGNANWRTINFYTMPQETGQPKDHKP